MPTKEPLDKTYGLRPSGHESVVPREHVQPRDDLAEICIIALDEMENKEYYQKTYEPKNRDSYAAFITALLDGIQADAQSANAVLLHPAVMQHKSYSYAGLFTSVLHNRLSPQVIMFDLPLSGVDWLGYRSPHLVVNASEAGKNFCYGAKKMINLGVCGEAAAHMEGIAINAGEVQGQFASHMNGVAINFGDVKDIFGLSADLRINYGKKPGKELPYVESKGDHRAESYTYPAPLPEFSAFMTELYECITTVPERFEERYGNGLLMDRRLRRLLGEGKGREHRW
jgi:hypothetical protein